MGMRRMRLAGGLGGGNERSRERTGSAAQDTARGRQRRAHPPGSLIARVPQEGEPLRAIQGEGMPSEERREMSRPPQELPAPAGLQKRPPTPIPGKRASRE